MTFGEVQVEEELRGEDAPALGLGLGLGLARPVRLARLNLLLPLRLGIFDELDRVRVTDEGVVCPVVCVEARRGGMD